MSCQATSSVAIRRPRTRRHDWFPIGRRASKTAAASKTARKTGTFRRTQGSLLRR